MRGLPSPFLAVSLAPNINIYPILEAAFLDSAHLFLPIVCE